MRLVLAAALAFAALPLHAGEAPRYLELVNRAHDSVVALAIAPANGQAFRDVPLRNAVRGGGGSTTVQIADAACRQDLKLSFRDGRTLVYRDLDVCRHARLRIGALPRDAMQDRPVLARNDRP